MANVTTFTGKVTPPFTGGAQRTLGSKVFESVSVTDFGALGDGSGDTIAEWLTGGSYDRGYANLAAIQVDYPEANDLANTIDQVAHWRAFQYAVANGRTVWTPDGDYVWARQLFTLNIADSFIWHLAPNAVIKRKDRTQISTWNRMILIVAQNDIDRVEIVGGRFDGNARQNPPLWQASEAVEVGDIRRNVDATTFRDNVYTCATAGTTAGSGGPQGITEGISDGTAVWDWSGSSTPSSTSTWWGWEQSAAVFVSADDYRIDQVLFKDLVLKDLTADGLVAFTRNNDTSRIGSAQFINIRRVAPISRPRPDIIWYQNVETVQVSDARVHRIECEYDHASRLQAQSVNIDNSICNILDLAGGGFQQVTWQVANTTALERSNYSSGRLFITNCDLATATGPVDTFYRNLSVHVANSTLRAQHRFDGGTFLRNLRPIGLNPDQSTGENYTLGIFNSFITFRRKYLGAFSALAELQQEKPFGTPGDYALVDETIYAWDRIGDAWRSMEAATFAPTGHAIGSNFNSRPETRDLLTTTVENCVFDEALERNVYCARNGRIILRNNTYRCSSHAIFLTGSADSFAFDVTIDGGDFSKVSGSPLRLDNSSANNLGESNIIYKLLGEWDRLEFAVASSNWVTSAFNSSRYKYAKEAPTGGGIIGDRVILFENNDQSPVEGVVEYTCTASHQTAATWVASKWAPQDTAIDASSGDTTSDLVAAMEFGKTYEVRLQETTALDGDTNKSFSLGDGTDAEAFLPAVTATGTAVGYAVVSGTENVGLPLRVTVTNNASATTGELTATVIVK